MKCIVCLNVFDPNIADRLWDAASAARSTHTQIYEPDTRYVKTDPSKHPRAIRIDNKYYSTSRERRLRSYGHTTYCRRTGPANLRHTALAELRSHEATRVAIPLHTHRYTTWDGSTRWKRGMRSYVRSGLSPRGKASDLQTADMEKYCVFSQCVKFPVSPPNLPRPRTRAPNLLDPSDRTLPGGFSVVNSHSSVEPN